MYKRASSMKYFAGDAVKFRLKLGEIQKGDVLFIERSFQENILYINGYNRRTYRIPERRIISKVPEKNKSVQPKNGTSPGEHLLPEAPPSRINNYHRSPRDS